jgi:hypothetical protein
LRRAILLLAGALLACEGRATDVRFERYTLTLAPGWEARRAPEERNHSALVLVPPGKTLLCRLELIHGDGELGSSDVDEFLAMARQDFRGSREQPVGLRTRAALLRGFAIRKSVAARAHSSGAQTGASEIEVYAGLRGRDLVAAIAGGWSRDPAGQHLRRQCLDAIRSMRTAHR